MSEFKFIVGQNVKVVSKDRNLNGKTFKVVSRHDRILSEDKNDTMADSLWYKVSPGDVDRFQSFFEDQLEPA